MPFQSGWKLDVSCLRQDCLPPKLATPSYVGPLAHMLRCYLSIQLTSFYPLLCVCLVLINGTSSFSGSSYGKESGCNAGDPGLIPGSGSSPAEGNGNPLQDSSLENPMDRRAWPATVHRVAKSRTRVKGLSTHDCTNTSSVLGL